MLSVRNNGSLNRSHKKIKQTTWRNKKNSNYTHSLTIILLFRAYADQTQTLNRMRGMLEDEMSNKRANKNKEI